MERASSKRAQTNYQDSKPADFVIKRKSAHTSAPFYKKGKRRSQEWEEGRQVIYQGRQELGNGAYGVEMFTTQQG